MPSYEYLCASCGEVVEEDHPIGTARRIVSCPECGNMARLRIGVGVNISAHALVAKGAEVRASDAMEDRWNADMPAYARMRKHGMQPPAIDGASRLEDTVGDQLDIELQRPALADVGRERYVAAKEQAAEIQRELANG